MQRKKFLLLLYLWGGLCWVGLFFFILSIAPTSLIVISVALVFLFFGLVPIFLILTRNFRRSVLLSAGIVSYLFLRTQELDSVVNVSLLILILISIDFFPHLQ